MFSGIVEGVGLIEEIHAHGGCHRVLLSIGELVEGLKIGDSLALNGACMTIVSLEGKIVGVDIIPESLSRTNLRFLEVGNTVNLERSMIYGERVSGHLVTGHVDGTSPILAIEPHGDAVDVTFETPPFWSDCIIEKGCVALDGMSLTIAHVVPGGFIVSFIPHTQEVTTFGTYQVGSLVNIEMDYLTKMISTRCQQYFETQLGKV